ncbi:Uncharacterised protein [Candidatus Burarchaeum australiense]|nr:Uncharacterised protein [Candidatus Burarchaeum australiense]
MGYTTIQILPETRKKLAGLKMYDRQTYDELLNALMSLVPKGDEEGEYGDEFRAGLLRARIDLAEGRTISHEELKKRLGL